MGKVLTPFMIFFLTVVFSAAFVFASTVELTKDKSSYATGETAKFGASTSIDDNSFPIDSVSFDVTGASGKVVDCSVPFDLAGYPSQDVACGGDEISATLSKTEGSGWKIIGFYTPHESDFSGEPKNVTLEDGTTRIFKSDFVSTVDTEGWGKTESGDYLGESDGVYKISDRPLDFRGNELEKFSSAGVDLDVIPEGTDLFLPLILSPWNEHTYKAIDIGPSVKGKVVNIYTGEGKEAETDMDSIDGTESAVFGEGFDSGDINFDYAIDWKIPSDLPAGDYTANIKVNAGGNSLTQSTVFSVTGSGGGNGTGNNTGNGTDDGTVTVPPYSQIDKSVSEPGGGGKKKKEIPKVELQEEPKSNTTINRSGVTEPPVEIETPAEPSPEPETPNPITGFFTFVAANLWAVIAAILFVLALLLYWKRAALAKMWKGGSAGKSSKNSKHSPNGGDSGAGSVSIPMTTTNASPTFSFSTPVVNPLPEKTSTMEIFDPKISEVPVKISVQSEIGSRIVSPPIRSESTILQTKTESIIQKQNRVEPWTSLPYLPLSNFSNEMSPTFSKSF